MNETAITLTPGMRDRLAQGHAGGSPVPNWDLPTLAGAGAIRSTAYDMLRFLTANMNLADAPPSLRVEENPLHDAMLETQRIHADHVSNEMSVGLGWHIRDGDGRETVWHNGGTGGYRSFVGFNRGGSLGVVVLTNSNESVDDLGFHVLDPSLPLTEVEPQDFPEEVDVSVDVLQTYVGTYRITPNFTVEVTLDGGRLYAQATGQPRFPIFASAQNEFFWKVVQASMTFNRDDEGNVVSILLHQNGADVPGIRAN
jgi:CubicO group peptidase (beta-lactamase class C family)